MPSSASFSLIMLIPQSKGLVPPLGDLGVDISTQVRLLVHVAIGDTNAADFCHRDTETV